MPAPKPPRPRPASAPDPEAANATIAEGTPPADPNATMLMDNAPPLPKKGAASPKLSVTRGPKAGAEFNIGPGETSIGRQGDNTIVIPDISVSRKHIVIRREGVRCILVDQGSGNGTMLNDARVEAETELQDGDIIVMGDTELTFLAVRAARPTKATVKPGARRSTGVSGPPSPRRLAAEEEGSSTGQVQLPFDPSDAKKRARKRLLVIAGVAVVFFVLLGAFKVRQNKQAAVAVAAAHEQAYQQSAQELDQLIEAGKKATNAGDYKVAAEAFQGALELAKAQQTGDSAWSSRISDAQRRYDAAKKEFVNQETLEAARQIGEKGELAAAVEKLKAIPEDSLTADRVGKVLEGFKAKIDERIAAGKEAVKNKSLDAARQAMTDVLAVDPANAEARTLGEAIQKAEAPPSPGKSPTTKAGPEDPTLKIVEAFNGGKLDEALGMAAGCNDPKCAALKEKMTAFKDLYAKIEAEGNVGKAMQILKSIPGGTNSAYMSKIGAVGSSTFVKEGLKAMTGENYPKAFAAFKQVLAVDPGNEVAKRNLGIIGQKAKEYSEQAYIDMTQDPDKARRGLELLLQITDPGSELNNKAKMRLKKLGGE